MILIMLSDPRASSFSVPPLREEREEREEPLFGSSEVRLGGTKEELGGAGGTRLFCIFFSLTEVDNALPITNKFALVGLRLARKGIFGSR